MAGARNNKQLRGRIHQESRAIFYNNVARGLKAHLGDAARQVDQIKFLVSKARVSRTQAQRLIKGLDTKPDEEAQAPNIDTVAFIAEALGVTAAQLLTQGCKFATDGQRSVEFSIAQLVKREDAGLGSGELHRPRRGRASNRE